MPRESFEFCSIDIQKSFFQVNCLKFRKNKDILRGLMEKTYLDSYNGFRRSVSEFGKHLIDSGLIAFGHRQSAPGVQGVINLELPLEVLQLIREAQAGEFLL